MSTDYKLLALDVDGTLVTDDLIITVAVKQALAAVAARGVVVTLATGRMFRSARQFSDELELDVPLICYQGAMVRQSKTGQTIYHEPIPLDLARQFLTLTQAKGYHVNAYVDDHLYVASLTEEARYYSSLARVPAEVVGDLLTFLDRPERAPTKLVVIVDEDRTLGVVHELEGEFGDKLYVTRSHARFAEVVNPVCNKGAALAALARSLDIPREAVMAVGDNLNDLPMLEWAGLSVAVANAAPVVKEKAGYVTQAVVGAGVVEAVNRFILS